MKKYEKVEMSFLPEKYRPLGAWAYFGYSILFNLPLIGWILAIVFSFSDKNINRRSFARSYFVGLIICIVILAAASVAIAFTIGFEALLTPPAA